MVAGRGNVGRSLARALRASGHAARLVSARGRFAISRSEALVLLAVPESAVAAMASRLAELDVPPAVSVVHVSGTLGLDALAALRDRHAVGSFHPLQSFPAPRPPEAFRGITVAVDASTSALRRRLEALARSLGARPRHVDDQGRALYHAAAVFASNYVIATVAEAVDVLGAAGWGDGEALGALMPLVEGVVANLKAQGPTRALTGPIRRGDAATVTRHLAALARVRGEPKPEAVYRMLGEVALEIAKDAGLGPAAAERTQRALTGATAATRRRRPV